VKNPKLIAFYLPQFHPIPENDQWWGKGFTEWTNVTKAKPLFRDHYQPHLPADLGFYDLRLPEARAAQAELAQAYGISGFCYYHYWFQGRRLLERPFDDVLVSGKPDFPFCLCWANENWTRAWDASENRLLVRQTYSSEDDLLHIRSLLQAFADDRYLRIDGKPLFLVYRSSRLPDPRRTTDLWRDEARRAQLGELFLCRVESFPTEREDPRHSGFDAAIEFQPDWCRLGTAVRRTRADRILRRLRLQDRVWTELRAYEYRDITMRMLAKPLPDYPRIPCVTPSWDNSARRGKKAIVFRCSTPRLFEHWLRESYRRFAPASPAPDVMFINAWNEWAEGNHLEPCQRWGRGYLEAVQKALISMVT
jgi:hypothetical protein